MPSPVRPEVVQASMAAWVEKLRHDRDREQARVEMLRTAMTASRAQLSEVRALERRRLVQAITATTRRDLNDIRQRLWRLQDDLADGLSEQSAARALTDVSYRLNELLDAFRTTVRGVFPAMLPERGPRAALEELAATLSRPVRFDGDLGRRVDWHIESGLYHAVSAVLQHVAGRESEAAVTVVSERDGALRVRVAAAGHDVGELRTALDHDASRLAVLGGAVTWAETADAAIIDIRLPERAEITGIDGALPRYDHDLYRQVWELVRLGRQAAGYGLAKQKWDAVAQRLSEPPRVAVLDDSKLAGRATASRVTATTVIEVTDRPIDTTLAAELGASDGPRGAIDAVLCQAPVPHEFRAALRSAEHRVALCESRDLDAVVAYVERNAPVLAARRAVVDLRQLVSELPPQHDVRRELDRTTAAMHEIAELQLLTNLELEGARVFSDAGVTAAALRLLGASGTSMRARLGLAADAPDYDARAAAASAAQWWRARAGMPTAGGSERAASDVLARTAERLLGQDS